MVTIKKYRTWIIMGLIIAVSLLCGWYFTLRAGVSLGDHFYYKVSADRYESFSHGSVDRTADNHFLFETDFGKQELDIQVDNHDPGKPHYSVSFAGGSTYEVYEINGEVYKADGNPLWLDNINSVTFNDQPTALAKSDYVYTVVKICSGNLDRLSSIWICLVGVIIFLLGMLGVFHPDETHMLFKRWRYITLELSDEGRIMEQIGSGIVALFGIAVMSGLVVFFVK